MCLSDRVNLSSLRFSTVRCSQDACEQNYCIDMAIHKVTHRFNITERSLISTGYVRRSYATPDRTACDLLSETAAS